MTANNDQLAPKAETKAKLVERLLKARNGASLTELVEATGWQAHTCRAFLTGLRKKGKAPIRDKRKDGTTFYKLAPIARTVDANKVTSEAVAEANA
jgi:DNA-binding transcriptional regulator PaaX